MPTKQVHKFEARSGDEVKFKHVKPLSEDGARFTVWSGDREWQVDVLEDDVQVVAIRKDGTLASLAAPDWMEEFASRVRHT